MKEYARHGEGGVDLNVNSIPSGLAMLLTELLNMVI